MENLRWLGLLRHAKSKIQEIREPESGIFFSEEQRRMLEDLNDETTPLCETGLAHSQRVAAAICKQYGPFHCLYCGTMTRQKQTLKAVYEACNANTRRCPAVVITPLLRERSMGYMFAMTDAEVLRHFPWWPDYLRTTDEIHLTFPGGNSLLDVYERCLLLLHELRCNRKSQKVLLITSWGPVMMLRAILENWDTDEILRRLSAEHPENCSLTVYDRNSKQGTLELTVRNQILCP